VGVLVCGAPVFGHEGHSHAARAVRQKEKAAVRGPQGKKMIEAASRFLSTLTDAQKSKAVLPFESEERFNWFFVPRERLGVTFKELSSTQREAALELLKTGLSAKGVKKTETIRELDAILKVLEAGRGPIRDPELYYWLFFGTPSNEGMWACRYEGHHISLHWTCIEGKIVATTPQFLGANPAEVRVEGPMKGTRVLAAEEDLGRALVKALSPEQLSEAVISDKAPADVLTSNQRQAAIQEDKGVPYSKLTAGQKAMLMAVIHEYADLQTPQLAKARIERLTKAGLETIKFAWMGGIERGQPHYYRIQGKTFLIELDNTQNDANHVHVVWRDFNGDFGRDLLADHYKTAGHDHGHNDHEHH
jgi:hypothetical protein